MLAASSLYIACYTHALAAIVVAISVHEQRLCAMRGHRTTKVLDAVCANRPRQRAFSIQLEHSTPGKLRTMVPRHSGSLNQPGVQRIDEQ